MSHIAIIGSGVVGSATGKGLKEKGHDVIFVDVNPITIETLKNEGYIACAPHELKDKDTTVFFISVPTPTAADGTIDLSYIAAATKTTGEYMKEKNEYCLVVIRSTVIPGTTEAVVAPILEETSGKTRGKDFGVCMNPEYLRYELQKNGGALKDFVKPWIIIIGELDERSGALLEEIYNGFDCPIHRIPLKEAEMQKYIHNIWNATKISFFNEMREACKKANVDPQNIFELVVKSAESSWNPRYGIRDLGPYSGMCLPKDAKAFLTWGEHELGLELSILESVIEVNERIKNQLK